VAFFGRKVGYHPVSPYVPELSLSPSVVCQLAQDSLRNYCPGQLSLPSLQPLGITLRGITNSAEDPSVDVWRAVTLPLLRKVIGADGQLQLKVARRGAPPKVCSAVHFRTWTWQFAEGTDA
jgi:RNA 3'-terminal phosphate cyclase